MSQREFPENRIALMLQEMPHRFTLQQFAKLYRTRYGHGDTQDTDLKIYSWKLLAERLRDAGAQQCGDYAIRNTRFIGGRAPLPAPKEAPQIALPLSKEPTTIERMEAKLAELQRVLQLQQQIKDIETQIEKF